MFLFGLFSPRQTSPLINHSPLCPVFTCPSRLAPFQTHYTFFFTPTATPAPHCPALLLLLSASLQVCVAKDPLTHLCHHFRVVQGSCHSPAFNLSNISVHLAMKGVFLHTFLLLMYGDACGRDASLIYLSVTCLVFLSMWGGGGVSSLFYVNPQYWLGSWFLFNVSV